MRQLLLLALAAGLLLAAGCSTDSPVSTTQGTVRILMTDAPWGGDYREAVNLVGAALEPGYDITLSAWTPLRVVTP